MTKSTGQRRSWPRSMSLRERFEANVPDRPEVGCWLWAGSTTKGGYGQLTEGPRESATVHAAHVLAYTLHVGPVPEGHEIEHVCEVKNCVRWTTDPALGSAHVQPATHAENMQRSSHRIGWGAYQRRKRAETREGAMNISTDEIRARAESTEQAAEAAAALGWSRVDDVVITTEMGRKGYLLNLYDELKTVAFEAPKDPKSGMGFDEILGLDYMTMTPEDGSTPFDSIVFGALDEPTGVLWNQNDKADGGWDLVIALPGDGTATIYPLRELRPLALLIVQEVLSAFEAQMKRRAILAMFGDSPIGKVLATVLGGDVGSVTVGEFPDCGDPECKGHEHQRAGETPDGEIVLGEG